MSVPGKTYRKIVAKYSADCGKCHGEILVGEQMLWSKVKSEPSFHADETICAEVEAIKARMEAEDANPELVCENLYTMHWPTAAGDTCRRCGEAIA